MNILREVRRFNNKSMPLRIISILMFCVISIVTTYAWFSSQKDVKLGGLTGDVTSWDVTYFVNGIERFDQTATFTVEQLYPGMDDWGDTVHIYNIGESSTNINYQLVSVKVFGEEVLPDLTIGVSGKTTTIFAGDTSYPFEISYTYDKDYMKEKYIDDATTPDAHAKLTFNVSWDYEIADDTTTAGTDESLNRDNLDTQFGKNAFAYYQQEGSDPSKAIEIKVRITSNFIHPSLDTGGPPS